MRGASGSVHMAEDEGLTVVVEARRTEDAGLTFTGRFARVDGEGWLAELERRLAGHERLRER